MSAIKSVPVSTDKIDLAAAAPIPVPFLVYVEPTSFCNLKCRFCPNPTVPASKKSFMPMATFQKIIDDIKGLPARPRVFKFCGVGESLLHRDIAVMIKTVRDTGSADRIIMYTNGVLLNPELNRKIVSGGLNQINISVEATDSEGYEKFAGAKVDFERYVENIRDLYEHREQLKIYVKIHSAAVKSESEKQKLYDIFENISDYISIEGLTHIWGDFRSELEEKVVDRYEHNAAKKRQICAISFKTLNINADGSCSPCSTDWQHKVIIGNIHEESLNEIWNGERLRALQERFCTGTIGADEACADCADYYVSGHEDLDAGAEGILSRLRVARAKRAAREADD